jgi:thioredoxin 1
MIQVADSRESIKEPENMNILVLAAVLGQFPSFQGDQDREIFPSFPPPAVAAVALPIALPVAESDVRLIAFTSTWCGPCARMKPVLASLQAEGIEVQHVDFDAEKALVKTYGVTTLPTTIVVRNGREIARRVGLVTIETLRTLAAIRPAKVLAIVRPKAEPVPAGHYEWRRVGWIRRERVWVSSK